MTLYTQALVDNFDVLKREMMAATNWHPWPETSLYKVQEGEEWRVFPFVHTFPAYDPSATQWVKPNCAQCPETVKILKSIPSIRTALYSRMGPGTRLSPHQGWAALSNHVLRTHLALAIPEEKTSGVWCEGKVQYHEEVRRWRFMFCFVR